MERLRRVGRSPWRGAMKMGKMVGEWRGVLEGECLRESMSAGWCGLHGCDESAGRRRFTAIFGDDGVLREVRDVDPPQLAKAVTSDTISLGAVRAGISAKVQTCEGIEDWHYGDPRLP
jgi:hypothetical protein